VESLSLDFRDAIVAEPGCVLLHCSIHHIAVWALALLARDTDLLQALAGSDEGKEGRESEGGGGGGRGRNFARSSCASVSEGGQGDGTSSAGARESSKAEGACVDSAGNGVWERVGRRWAERGNIGFSAHAAPAKAKAMCLGIALGKGLETLARDLEISLGEVESWITALGAAFPALGRTVSALRRGSNISGNTCGGGVQGGGTAGVGCGHSAGGKELRSISGRLLVDTTLASGGWERVRKVVSATSNDLKKALFLSVCHVMDRDTRGPRDAGADLHQRADGRGGQEKDGAHVREEQNVCGVSATVAQSRVLLMTERGALLQVGSESVERVIAEVRSAFAAVAWMQGGSAGEGHGSGELGCRYLVVDFVYGHRFGSLV